MSEKDTVTPRRHMTYCTDKMQMMSCSHGANKRRFEFKSRMKRNRLIQPKVITFFLFLTEEISSKIYRHQDKKDKHWRINAHRHSALDQT